MLKCRVTKEQEIGEKGEKQVFTKFTDLGWNSHEISPDYGEDLIINVSDEGIPAGLAFLAQVKSTDNVAKFQLKKGDNDYSYSIEIKDLNHWRDFRPPVVLILWDTNKLEGYWVTVEDATVRLDRNSPGWQERSVTKKGEEPKIKVLFPSANKISEETLTSLRLKVASISLSDFHKGREMKMNLDFSFPSDEQGRKGQEGLKRFLDFGEGVTVSGHHIKSIRFPDWYERKYGKTLINPTSQITLGPRRSKQVDQFRLTFLSSERRVVGVQMIDVMGVYIGEKQITFSNEHRPTPFSFRLIYRQDGYITLNISMRGAKTSARETLDSYRLFYEIRSGGFLRVEITSRPDLKGKSKIIEADFAPNPDFNPSSSFMNLLEKMSFIEQKMATTFVITDDPIDEDDWGWVYRVTQILETGKIEYQFKTREEKWSGGENSDEGNAIIPALLKSFKEKQPLNYDADIQETQIMLLGAQLSLGPSRSHVEGQLSAKSAGKLKKLYASGRGLSELDFVIEDGSFVQEYPQWLVGKPSLPAPKAID